MKSPHSFIIRPVGGVKYSTERAGIIMSASTEDARYTNRYAEVIETPIGYEGDIKIGDTIITHHNVFRSINNMLGKEELSAMHIDGDNYFVDESMIYMYKDTEWHACYPFIFVKPVEKIQGFLLSTEHYEKQHGVVKFAPTDTVPIDQYIVFSPDSEYEFDVEGEMLYRMKLSDICLTLKKES